MKFNADDDILIDEFDDSLDDMAFFTDWAFGRSPLDIFRSLERAIFTLLRNALLCLAMYATAIGME